MDLFMYRSWITVLMLILSIQCAQAQASTSRKAISFFDFAVSASPGRFSVAPSWLRMHGLGKRERYQIGYGIRFTSFIAANKFYTTAPAKYTSTRQDVTTLFSETINANIDTITTATAITYSMNVTFNAQYRIWERWDVGLNIDLAGVSFGPDKKFDVISSSFDPDQEPVQHGSPTRFNLLLTSDNDIGSLNSEFFVRYRITNTIGVRAGYTFLFSEYRIDKTLSFDRGRIVNDRYRYKASMALVAITFSPFH